MHWGHQNFLECMYVFFLYKIVKNIIYVYIYKGLKNVRIFRWWFFEVCIAYFFYLTIFVHLTHFPFISIAYKRE
jgi:hypothetical protein